MLNMRTGGIPRMQANVSYRRAAVAVLRELCAMHDATARSQGSPASENGDHVRPSVGTRCRTATRRDLRVHR